MELLTTNNSLLYEDFTLPFVEANTLPVQLHEMESSHIIPVYTKDNHALISQHEFIYATYNVLSEIHANDILGPYIRVSHPIRGRVPSARFKKVHELLPHEETLYYERMMFVYIIPSITKVINGQELKLVLGGVKAYNKDNLNKNSNALQHFTFFIGFQVKVCSNLCVWSDGINNAILVNSVDSLSSTLRQIISAYDPIPNLDFMNSLTNYILSERQFAHLLGRCRMSNFLPKDNKKLVQSCGLNDSQLTTVTKQYYQDANFSSINGCIDLWSLYNLFTGSLKSSYLDTIVDNNVQVGHFFTHLTRSLDTGYDSWYLIP